MDDKDDSLWVVSIILIIITGALGFKAGVLRGQINCAKVMHDFYSPDEEP